MSTPTFYPVTAGQEVILYLRQFYHKKEQALNVCARVDVLSDINEDRLIEAMFLSAIRIPSCRTRFCVVEGKVVQYISDESPQEISIVDLSDKTDDEIQNTLEKWSCTAFENVLNNEQLYDFRIVRTSNNGHTLFFRTHHLIMDAYALMSTVSYIGEMYSALTNAKPLPSPLPSPAELIDENRKYFESPRFIKDQEYWNKDMATEPQFTSINGINTKEFVKGKRYGHGLGLLDMPGNQMDIRIPADLVKKINEASENSNLSPLIYYTLALHAYLGKVCNTEDVMSSVLLARRSRLIEKRSGGTRVIFQLIRTQIENSQTFKESLAIVKQKEDNAFRHCNYPAGASHQILDKKFSVPLGDQYYSTAITYQPYFSFGDGKLKFAARRLKTGYTTSTFYLTIMPHDDSGDLWCNYEYSIRRIKPENVEKFHTFMLKFLEAGIKNPERTIKDLVDECL